jgi:hypothetical protein
MSELIPCFVNPKPFGTLNSAYITLLPKKYGADQPKDLIYKDEDKNNAI